MTGHNFLNRHNYIVNGIDNNPECDLCAHGYIQDTEHIIAECPRLMGLRLQIFGQHILHPPYTFISTGQLLAFLHRSGLQAVDWRAPPVPPS